MYLCAMRIYLLSTIVLFLLACERIEQTIETNTASSFQQDSSLTQSSLAQKNITIPESSISKEQKNTILLEEKHYFGDIEISIQQKDSIVHIQSAENTIDPHLFWAKGKINIIETDVNQDGFNEIYCVSQQGGLFAIASYRNKSFGEIYIPQKPFSFYKDCQKFISWEVKHKKLSLIFENEKGEANIVRYALVEGETSYQLQAK